jgi:hypothetical protein
MRPSRSTGLHGTARRPDSRNAIRPKGIREVQMAKRAAKRKRLRRGREWKEDGPEDCQASHEEDGRTEERCETRVDFPRGDARYIRRDAKGRIKESDEVGRSPRADRARKAKRK